VIKSAGCDYYADSFSSWRWGELSIQFPDRQTFSTPTIITDRFREKDHPGHTVEEFFEFREAFLKSGQPSIDAFLERRSDFLDVGKFAIAYCLIPFEDENKLYKQNVARGGDWYEYLSARLNSPFADFGKNKLSIITFNYDRSLEHYLLNSLHSLHGRPFDECAKALAQIPIIHVYGQLGKVPYPQPGCHPYRPVRESTADVVRAAAGITLLHEEASDLKQAYELLTDARRICFLGFGYHPMNLERLTLKDSDRNRVAFGTALGLLGKEVTDVKGKLIKTLLVGGVILDDADSLVVLRSHLILG
jgi:hypothetical protein